MIVRLIAIDPRPRAGALTDVLVYQVPENSREFELLAECFKTLNITWDVIEPPPRKSKGRDA